MLSTYSHSDLLLSSRIILPIIGGECTLICTTVTSQNEKTTLLGKTKQDYASILRWMSFSNAELLPQLAGWFRPLIGRDSYNKKAVDDHMKASHARLKVLEDHLMINTYLVGERLTLADLFCTALSNRGFQFVFDKEWRDNYPSITRWYTTVANQPIYSDIAGKVEFIEKAVPNPPPKQEQPKKQEKQPKQQQSSKKAAAAKEEDDEEEEEKPVPKPKHPLEALPKPTFVLDDW